MDQRQRQSGDPGSGAFLTWQALLLGGVWSGMLRGLALVLALAALQPARAETADEHAYLGQLQSRARELGLGTNAQWRALLHMKRQPLTRQWRSLADDPDFFVAPDGKTDPVAELDATLAAFFSDRQFKAEQTAQCRFRARFEWLRNVLHFDAARMAPQPCTRYDEWRAGVRADRLSLVYPAAYIDSPASMYGHTLLRLDSDAGAAAQQPLLAYSISYAADAGEGGSDPFYELKGLIGAYSGAFTNAPYYQRIRDYTHLEDRDIWEYRLNLAPDELERLVAHTWELGHTRFDYWFFDENCAYHLLSLLDAARPALALTDRYTWWAIPGDTVRSVTDVPGLVGERHYRPSNGSQLRARAAALSPAQREQAQDLASGRLLPQGLPPELDETARARTLELAERLVAWHAAQRQLGNDEAQSRRMALLGARARLAPLPEPPTPEPAAPETGHRTTRLTLGVGRADGHAAWRLRVHPAYHDLMDPEQGFSRGAQIRFFDLEAGQRAGERPRLESLTLVDVLSVAPRDALGSTGAWKVNFGVQRSFASASPTASLGFGVNGGPGYAWGSEEGWRPLAYVLMDNQLWYDPDLPRRTPWAFGSGLHAGVLFDPLPAWRWQFEAHERHFLAHQPRERSLDLRQRWQLDASNNLVGHCTWQQRSAAQLDSSRRECFLGWQRYW